MSVCYIISAGDCEKIEFTKKNGDIVIAADGGYKYCLRDDILPDVIIGDFDSLGYVPETIKTVTLPVAKDDTDTAFCVKYAMQKGYSDFVIFGGVGGKRADHTFANIALLAYISKNGGTAFLDCGSYSIAAITNSKINFDRNLNGDVSVFSFDTVSKGVTEKGLLYSLENAEIKNSVAVGVSNAFTGQNSSVSVNDGTLIIYFCGKNSDCTIDK